MFGRIVGRAASSHEVAQLYRIRDALKLPDDDPFWMVLYALEYYKVLYEEIPGKIDVVVDRLERLLADANRALPLPVIEDVVDIPCPAPSAGISSSDMQAFEAWHAEILATIAGLAEGSGKQLDSILKDVANMASAAAAQGIELPRAISAIAGQVEDMRRESLDSTLQIKDICSQLGKRVDAVRRQVGAAPDRAQIDYKVVGAMIIASSMVSSILTAVLVRFI